MSGPWGSTPWGAVFGTPPSSISTDVDTSVGTASASGNIVEVEGSTPSVPLAPWASAPWGALTPPAYPYALVDASLGVATANGYAVEVHGPTSIEATIGPAAAGGYAVEIDREVEFPFGWGFSKSLIVKHDQVTGSHANFPVYITEASLPEEMWLGSRPAQIDGGDIRFTLDAEGTIRLPLAIIEWVPGTRAKFLVQVPGVNDATDVAIYVWCGASRHQRQPAHDEPYGALAALPPGLSLAVPLVGQHALGRLAGTDGIIYRATNPTTAPLNEVYSQKVVDGHVNNKHNAFTNMAKMSDGTVLLGFKEDASHISTASAVFRIYASTDGGESWSLRSTIDYVSVPIDTQSFMGMLFVAPDDTVYVFGQRFDLSVWNGTSYGNYVGTGWIKSMDGARTWGGYHDIDSRLGLFCPPRLSVDGETVLVPFYEASTVDTGQNTVAFRPWLYVFDLATESFIAKNPVTSNSGLYTEWSCEQTPSGRIVGLFRRNGYSAVYRNWSDDGGVTWNYSDSTTNWQSVLTTTAALDHPCVLKTHDDKLLLAYSADRGNGDIRVALSDDWGVTWRSRYAALRGGHDPTGQTSGSFGGYAGLVELAPDHIIGSWYYEDQGLYGSIYVSHIRRHDRATFDDLEWWNVPELSTTSTQWGGRAVEISGTNTLAYYGHTAFKNIHNGGPFTLWAWAKFNDVASATVQCLLGSSYQSGTGAKGIAFSRDNRGGGNGTNALRLTAENSSGITIDAYTNGILPTAGSWQMVGARSAGGVGGAVYLRVNDAEYTHASEIASVGTSNSTNYTVLGASYDGASQTFQHNGGLAWLWMSEVDLGADWLDTHYANFANPAAFVEASSDVDIAVELGIATASGYLAEVEGEWFGVPVEVDTTTGIALAKGEYAGVDSANVLTPADIAAIADAVWADPVAVAAHAKLDAILARLTC